MCISESKDRTWNIEEFQIPEENGGKVLDDCISSHLLKKYLYVKPILYVYLLMVSLKKGVTFVPNCIKNATVLPLQKGKGKDRIKKYSPIFLLTALLKVLEKSNT